jgi:3-oxoacyl-[acyl-carrier protein] reductase
MNRRLESRVCIVTGAARGIGLAIAERFGKEGARLACIDVSDRRLNPAVDSLKAKGFEARAYNVDVSRQDDVRSAFEKMESDFGEPVSALVNNAVFARFQPLQEIDADTAERMLGVGLLGLIWTTQAVVPQMVRRGGGAIVNLSSIVAEHPTKDAIVYAAVKAGVLGLSRASAIELCSRNIRVNAIAPGMIGTPASVVQYDEATIAKRRAEMPMGRFGEPEEIAALAAFLVSDDASYVQGATVTADGGWTIPSR